VHVVALGSSDGRRVHVRSEVAKGWITAVTFKGQVLLMSPEVKAHASGAESSLTKTVLELARAGDAQALQTLLEGVTPAFDLNCCDIRSRTPLMFAACSGSPETVRCLLSHGGVRVNALDDTQKTVLHHLAKQKWADAGITQQVDILRELVSAGVMVDKFDYNGCTALMFAAATGQQEMVNALLSADASVNAKDFDGHAPVYYAHNFGHVALVKNLLASGASESELLDPAPGDPTPRHRSSIRRPSALLGGRRQSQQPLGLALQPQHCTASQVHGRRNTRMSILWSAGLSTASSGGAQPSEVLPAPVLAVEEPIQGVTEEELARQTARKRLEVMMSEGDVAEPREMEEALKEAVWAGVEEADLQNARNRLKALQERARAHDALLAAITERDPVSLQEAIQSAEERRLPSSEVDRARAILFEELPKQQARDRLREAEDKGNTMSLRAALEEARRVNLSREELGPFEELLTGAETKEQAEEELRRAIEDLNVIGLRFAIHKAKEAKADASQIAKAEAVLQEEEPKLGVRDLIANLEEDVSAVELEDLIDKAKDVNLHPNEYEEVEDRLTRMKERERAVNKVRMTIADVRQGCDKADYESLVECRRRLTYCVKEARDAGAHEVDLSEADGERRRLHNSIQDMKGAIRVFCRVRPLNTREKDIGDAQITQAVDSMTLKVDDVDRKGESLDFSFDAVFMPGTQEEVFNEAQDLVQSALDGYNVTIFAYGQTGAGKTFTMYGASNNEGVAPRTIRELFRLMDVDKERFTYTVIGSMMELYRNELVDLLAKQKNPKVPVKSNGVPKAPKPSVHVDKAGSVQVEHVVEEQCQSAEELSDLLERGNGQRTVAATAMNSESSRSHLLLVIKIVRVSRETGQQTRGKILLCDLAGSERLNKSKVSGDMQKEAIEINKSLTALGDVIEGLTKGHKHVPYRNHTLTQVMQDALGGSSKTLMFVNCSPAHSNADETVMALKYATRAKTVTNEAKRKTIMMKTT